MWLSLIVVATISLQEPDMANDDLYISDQTRACVLEHAPRVERAFDSLLEGAEYTVRYLCAYQISDDFIEQERAMLERTAPVREAQNQHLRQRLLDQGIPEDEVDDRMIPVSVSLPHHTPRVEHWIPTELKDFIGRTLLEHRIDRIEAERQEEN